MNDIERRCYEDLAIAIIEKACFDYMNGDTTGKTFLNKGVCKNILDYFNISPEYVIRILDERKRENERIERTTNSVNIVNDNK